MTPTPEQIKALYDVASRLVCKLAEQDIEKIQGSYEELFLALLGIDGGAYNPNLNFGGWLPIEIAPKDGRLLWVKGFDRGNKSGPVHVHKACFVDGDSHAENELLLYLTHYKPYPEMPKP
jgi:hypothetical protein